MILYLFTFLAGIATVLSPCVLPVLPAILSAGLGRGRYRPLGIIIGLMVSFALFTLALTFFVHLLGISANALRYLAMAIIALFGLVMLFPALGDRFALATSSIATLGAQVQSHASQQTGFKSGLLLGAALGLVWTPCAGPILAVITTLVATQNVTTEIILLTLAYSLGSGIPLFLIAYGGNKALTAIPFLARHSEGIKRFFGALMILTAIGLFFHFEVYLQQIAVKYIPTLQIENNPDVRRELDKLRPASPFSEETVTALKKVQGSELPRIAPAPEIAGIEKWINSESLTLTQLRGKVVLIDFWTYSCINCIRTLPYLTSWYDRYKDKGFVIIGVHTPEFEFEKDSDNVVNATERFHIHYPVALDNTYQTWQAYHNLYWPAHYLIDQEGIIRQVHFGEGGYLGTENAIRNLLGLSQIEGKEPEREIARPITHETYLGASRAKDYQSDIDLKPNEVAFYGYLLPLGNDRAGLKGQWLVESEKITSQSDVSELDLNFIATRVYLVMDSVAPHAVAVFLDGVPLPKKYYTADMNANGEILVSEARKYDVINLKGEYGRHVLSLQIPKDVSAYAFTFGDEP